MDSLWVTAVLDAAKAVQSPPEIARHRAYDHDASLHVSQDVLSDPDPTFLSSATTGWALCNARATRPHISVDAKSVLHRKCIGQHALELINGVI